MLRIQIVRVMKRLICQQILAQLSQDRTIECAQRKDVWPAAGSTGQWDARFFQAIQLIVGEREVVLHLRGLRRQFGGTLQWFESRFWVSMLPVDRSQRSEFIRVIRII